MNADLQIMDQEGSMKLDEPPPREPWLSRVDPQALAVGVLTVFGAAYALADWIM